MLLKKLVVGGFLTVLLSASLGAMAAELPGTKELKVKTYNILAIDDCGNVFNSSLFPDIAEQPEKAALMPGGKAEGTYRTYLVQNKKHDRIVLIDAGWGKDGRKQGQTIDVLKAKGIAPEQVTDILMTHLDGDHIAGLVNKGLPMYPKAKLHMSKAEYEGWLVRGDARNPKSIANAKKITALYNISTFEFGEEPIKGILSVATVGHTIGHTAYQFGKGAKGLLIIGDVLHVEPLQLRFTDYSSRYDEDKKQAAITRERVLKEALKSRITIAGMHFKSIGKVEAHPEGGYKIKPVK